MDARPPCIALCIMANAPASGHVKTRLCPPLSLEEAARLYGCFLEDLAPGEDGGYYLIGLGRVDRALFEDTPWSTPIVLEETLRRGSWPTSKPVADKGWSARGARSCPWGKPLSQVETPKWP